MSEIHFIGGEKGGVGKSVVARLLAQYWIDTEKNWCGYDADLSHGALRRYYGDYAKPLDFDRIEALDSLIEAASGEPDLLMLVDLASQSERKFHTWLEGVDIQEMKAELDLRLVFWHVMDDGKDSVNLLERMVDTYQNQVQYIVVKNRLRGDNFDLLEESEVYEKIKEMKSPIISIKALHHPIMKKIDLLDKSFWAAVNNVGEKATSLGLMERQRVKSWLKYAYGEFERIGL